MTKLTKTKTLLLFSLRFLSAAEGQTPWNYLIVLVGIFVWRYQLPPPSSPNFLHLSITLSMDRCSRNRSCLIKNLFQTSRVSQSARRILSKLKLTTPLNSFATSTPNPPSHRSSGPGTGASLTPTSSTQSLELHSLIPAATLVQLTMDFPKVVKRNLNSTCFTDLSSRCQNRKRSMKVTMWPSTVPLLPTQGRLASTGTRKVMINSTRMAPPCVLVE